jgi:hypothetical protein
MTERVIRDDRRASSLERCPTTGGLTPVSIKGLAAVHGASVLTPSEP